MVNSTCRSFDEGTCRFGDNCSQAHSAAELDEWRDRFEQHKEHLQHAHSTDVSCNQFAAQLMEKWLTASDNEQLVSWKSFCVYQPSSST